METNTIKVRVWGLNYVKYDFGCGNVAHPTYIITGALATAIGWRTGGPFDRHLVFGAAD